MAKGAHFWGNSQSISDGWRLPLMCFLRSEDRFLRCATAFRGLCRLRDCLRHPLGLFQNRGPFWCIRTVGGTW